MKILFANKFFFLKGGAEQVMFDEAELARSHGHEVGFFSMKHSRNHATDFSKYFVGNLDYTRRDLPHVLKVVSSILYSVEAKNKMRQLLGAYKPDIAHLHNIYHQISPSIIYTLKKAGIPIVMTLHDYKGVCASYSMVADGKVCEACKGGKYYQCLLRGCVKDSRVKSFLSTTEMYLHHKLLHIYDLVDVFISPSIFLREKMFEMGFKGRIEHIPNFINAAAFTPVYQARENSIIYVGRLSHEKGVQFLVEAVKGLDVTLKFIGDGPLKAELQTSAEGHQNIKFLGFMSGEALRNEVKGSLFTIMPSACYENHPLAVIESFALGKPVVGARIGGIPELVKDGETGYTFTSFNADDLRNKIRRLAADPEGIVRMGQNARRMVERELDPVTHYERLMRVYRLAMEKK